LGKLEEKKSNNYKVFIKNKKMNGLKQNHIIILALVSLLIVLYFMSSKNNSKEEPVVVSPINVTIQTTKGDIGLLLYADKTPKTVANFIELANADYYDGVKFHRVMKDFMIQSGDYKTKDDSLMDEWGSGDPGWKIEDEFVEGVSNMRGTISMANSGPNTGGSQWFINLVDNQFLDFDRQPLGSKHAVFGKVISGMDVVDAIGEVETEGPEGSRPVEPIVITDVIVGK